MHEPRSPLPVPFLAILSVSLLGAGLLALFGGRAPLAEGGPVEGASALALAATAVTFVPLAGDRLRRLWAVPAALALMTMRELDWDKAFLAEGVLQLRLYSGDAPASHKAIGAAVVLAILAVLWRLARLAPAWLRALRARAAWAWTLAGALLAAVVSKSLDGLARKLAPLGIDVPDAANALASAAEEVLELGFALALALAVSYWARGSGGES